MRIPRVALHAITFFLSAISLSLAPSASAQQVHGEIVEVRGAMLRVELSDTLTVESGVEGRVLQIRTVGGREVQVRTALVSVEQIETPQSGPWVAVCRVERQSETPQVGDKMRFASVQARPARLIARSDTDGAVALIDGERLGSVPVETRLQPGTYTVRLIRDGFESREQRVQLRAGEQRLVNLTLTPQTGTIVVNTLPDGATVTVEGQRIGRSPVEAEMKTGTYEVRIEREGYETSVRSISVSADTEERLNVQLRRPLAVQAAQQQEGAVKNVRVEREGDQLLVTYDLAGSEDEYEVSLLLSTDGGQTFQPLPETIQGAVGEEVIPGSGQRIVWAVLEDFPMGLSGERNRLQVIAREQGGGNGLLWVIGGALAAGAGGTVALLLGGGGDDGGGGNGGGPGGFPTPPSPPGN
jgi:hypothetical protein